MAGVKFGSTEFSCFVPARILRSNSCLLSTLLLILWIRHNKCSIDVTANRVSITELYASLAILNVFHTEYCDFRCVLVVSRACVKGQLLIISGHDSPELIGSERPHMRTHTHTHMHMHTHTRTRTRTHTHTHTI